MTTGHRTTGPSSVPDHPLCNVAWTLIVQARGHVSGKTFRMSPPTLAALLRERQEYVAGFLGPNNPRLQNRSVYGVRVVLVVELSPNVIRLEK